MAIRRFIRSCRTLSDSVDEAYALVSVGLLAAVVAIAGTILAKL